MTEQRKNKTRERIRTVAFMVTVTFVSISFVSGAHLLTRERVALNESLFLKKAVLTAAGVRDLPTKALEVDALYSNCVQTNSRPGIELCYEVREGAQHVADVMPVKGAGLWGTIHGVVGIDPASKTLIQVEFVQQNETPGLGARIEEEWFRTQFRGKRGPLTMVKEDNSTGDTEFEAVTGATITSTAVRDMLNRALEAVADVSTEAH